MFWRDGRARRCYMSAKQSGKGKRNYGVACFETTVFLVGQHYGARRPGTGQSPPPCRPDILRGRFFQLFDTQMGEQVFVGFVSDGQWKTLRNAFGLEQSTQRSRNCVETP